MKVFDLMQMYVNKEVLPKKIIIHDHQVFDEDTIWEHKDNTFYCREYNGDIQFLFEYIVPEMLNDEVEIIEDKLKYFGEEEKQAVKNIIKKNSVPLKKNYLDYYEDTPKEDKKIEKLDLSDWWEITSSEDCKPEMLAKIFNKNAKAFSSKINEIIDRLND